MSLSAALRRFLTSLLPWIKPEAETEDPQIEADQQIRAHIHHAFLAAEVSTDPFPHLVIKDIIPPGFYATMLKFAPSNDEWDRAFAFKSEQPYFSLRGERDETTKTLEPFCASFAHFQVYIDLIDNLTRQKFAPYIDQYFDRLIADGVLLERPSIAPGQSLFCRRTAGWRIPPHTHDLPQIIQSMIYFADRNASPRLGTELYRLRKPMRLNSAEFFKTRVFKRWEVKRVKSMPYVRNTLASFLNTPEAIHASPTMVRAPARVYIFTGSQVSRDAFRQQEPMPEISLN